MLIATSWDDGLETDKRLIRILEKYGVRSSFAITPGRHREYSAANDPRHPEAYGTLVKIRDVHMYTPHEVCNHTFSHQQMDLASSKVIKDEVEKGKSHLEYCFNREITGIIWPYGISTELAIQVAKDTGHKYGRSTPGNNSPAIDSTWHIRPLSWRSRLDDLLDLGIESVVLSGHTYEMSNEDDWEQVDNFYREASASTECALVTIGELMESICD